jgi:PAT family beta-lactamase induction signal transducer AmpG
VHTGNLLASRRGRFLTFCLLYISEGIPYGFTSTAMVALMRAEGLALGQIGMFVAAMFIPWAFKWVWAPLVDLVPLGRLGGRKAWILFCSTMMITTLLMTAVVDFVANFELLLWMIVLNNFFCATQDVAIDSLAVSTLESEERGRGNGFMFAGQYLGIALGGGAAIGVAGVFSFEISLLYVSALLFLNLMFVIFFVRDPAVHSTSAGEKPVAQAKSAPAPVAFMRELYRSFLRSGPGPKIGLLFAILPTGTMALGYATLSTIQVDYGLHASDIARLSIYNTIAAGLGCLIGGFLGDRFGIRRMVGMFYLLTTLPTLALAFAIWQAGLLAVSVTVLSTCIVVHGLFFGMAFGLQAAIFMGITNPAVAATQFTAFMAMTNIAISIANYWQGLVGERFDYETVLILDAALVIVPLAVLPFVKSREESLAVIPQPA